MSNTDQEQLLQRVIEVTGVSVNIAQHLLGACANDVDAAVALYFEQGPSNFGNNSPSVSIVDDSEDVRSPLLPVRQQLVGPGDDNFMYPITNSGPPLRIEQHVRVYPSSDFAREGALLEQELETAATAQNNALLDMFASSIIQLPQRAHEAAGIVDVVQLTEATATSQLDDLYRPPTDIAHVGTIQTARNRAIAMKRWLLVNVQGQNFDSDLLNRDVWSDQLIRKLICRKFLLWQVDAESVEGRRFVAFYNCSKLPYVCIVDPRTGEEVWKSTSSPKHPNLLQELRKFLQAKKDFAQELDDSMPSTSKRVTDEPIYFIDDDDSDCELVGDSVKKRARLIDLTEEEQMEWAIKNSMRDNGMEDDNENSDDEKLSVNDIEEVGGEGSDKDFERERDSTYEAKLGSAKDELTVLKLRLRDAEGADEMVELRWPSDTRLEVLRLYIAQRHGHIPKTGYKLICVFPRKTLEAEHDGLTLKELGLHPSANLHLLVDY